MKSDFFIGVKSPVHAWDARWKCPAFLALVCIAAFVQSPPGLAAAAGCALILMVASRVPAAFYLKTLKYPVFMLVVMTPLLILSAGGASLMDIGPLSIYTSGLEWSGTIGVRSLSIVAMFSVLVMTTRYDMLVKSMEYFHVPNKLIFIFLSTYRFIFLFFELLHNSFRAARLRGYHAARSFFHFTTVLDILISLLVHGFEQTERTNQAMILRGYQNNLIVPGGGSTSASDLAKSGAAFSVAIAVILIEIL
ncbi:MAG: cobalt ECF transporter T component CbiQ [Chitinivibrionales bacterium]|nr:cobalt ECF transporter T component CbiQ [Chitinivibrionales bacterium]